MIYDLAVKIQAVHFLEAIAKLLRQHGLMLGDRLMVGLQFLDLPIGVRIPVSQPKF